jgi:hypothetical protein
MPDRSDEMRRILSGEWLHSKEEDTSGTLVLRRPGFDFPPARFRKQWDLRGDGTSRTSKPGADDRLSFGPAQKWRITDDGTLEFSQGGVVQARYELISADENRAVLKKVEQM